jgi:hypothetical protein
LFFSKNLEMRIDTGHHRIYSANGAKKSGNSKKRSGVPHGVKTSPPTNFTEESVATSQQSSLLS